MDRRLLGWAAGAGALGVLVLVALSLWYVLIRDDAPPPADLDAAAEAAADLPGVDPSAEVLIGTWSVPRIPVDDGEVPDDAISYVGFRIREELASIGTRETVGRTPSFERARLLVEGSAVTAVEVVADLTDLRTDDSRRDEALRTRALETDEFATATFVLTEAIELGRVPGTEETFTVDATGELTLHGVTRQITVPVEAVRQGDVLTVVGRAEIALADFDIDRPQAAQVLSVADTADLELVLTFVRD